MQALTASSNLPSSRLVGLRDEGMQLFWQALSVSNIDVFGCASQVLLAADHSSFVVAAAGVGPVAVPLLLRKAG
jgi:hypothetical protein